MSQPYARDLAITAVICFFGGVGLTLLVVLICYQMSRKKKLKESKRQKEEEEGSTVISNHVNHIDVNEKRRELFMQNSNSQTLDRNAMMLENHGGQLQSGGDDDRSHVRCLDCTKAQRVVWADQMRWNNGINREVDSEEEREKRRMRAMMTEEERRKPGSQQGILSRDGPNKLLSLGNSNSLSHPWRETFHERPETLTAYKTDRNMDIHRTGVEGRSNGNEALHCESCHRTYRSPEHTMRPGRTHSNMRDSALFDGFPPQHRLMDMGRKMNYNQLDMMKNTDFRRESRHVTFDLERGEGRREKKGRTSRDKEKGRNRRQKVKKQSPGKLKVKLNLSPPRKSKVHPKRNNDQGHLEKRSSEKSKEKRKDEKEKEGEEGKSKSDRKTKGSSKKVKKSTKTTGLSEEEKETKEDGEGQATSKQKKTDDTAADKEENTNPDNPQPADGTSTADQSASARTIGQGQNLQGGSIQCQEAGLLLTNAQLSSQHPFSLSAADRNCTANLSLLGSADSHLTGSSLSLQGGNILLNTMAPGSNALFPKGQANTVAPILGPSSASSGVNSFNRQTGVGLMSPATALLANSVHANTLQASVLQTIPLYNSQAGELSKNMITNPVINPVPKQAPSPSQLPPDSSPLVAGLQNDAARGPSSQTVEGQHQLPLETPAAQSKERLPVQAQAAPGTDGLTGVTPQAPGSVTSVERLSDYVGQTGTEHVPGGSTDKMPAVGVALPGGAAVGLSGDSMEAANVSVSGVCVPGVSTHSGSSTGADGAAALLQQEYVSEEGRSSPRRKLRLVLPEKTSSRPPTALERKIR
ncbi:unnamed protein product [Pleuronectes platessa]|uniref:Uncharacterized protein n=1 Tax=Pleuronectes platessa TaxID=8262 RepID=A0A9N7YCC6_PLEPL|nr:unnamed protein product [Pleuronectes platessa]